MMKHIIRTRRAGMVYIAISIVLGVVAVNSSNNLLYLTTAVLLGYMLASGIAGRRNIRSASVTIAFPDEIYAQIPCVVSVQLINKSRLIPLFMIEVGFEKDYGGKRVFFPIVQPGQLATMTLFATFPTRGHHKVEDIELSSVYPFDFFVRYWPVDFKETVTVFPVPLRCDPETVLISQERKEHEHISASSVAETDIVGVRPYAQGDSMKRIHWKSSARTGKLKTRLYDGSASRSARTIDLDRLLAGGVERGLSMATYAVTESIKSGVPVGLRTRKALILPESGIAHKRDLLTRLALYADEN